MAKQGDVMDDFENRGEQNLDFPMAICPNQSLLVEELKSKFEGIDRRFYTLFEHFNDNSNFNANTVPKPATPNPTAHIICRQISKVLQQWTGRHTQNYFELKHISQLLNAFAEETVIKEMGSVSLFRELERSWWPAKCLGTLFLSLLFLPISVTLGFVVVHQKFHFGPPDHFREVPDLKLSGKGHPNHQTANSLHEVLNVSLWTVQFH